MQGSGKALRVRHSARNLTDGGGLVLVRKLFDRLALDNPFYAALDKLLRKSGFDEFAEETCRESYAERMGRPGLPPGVYFRMLMVGYLEGIGSERGIAWRCGDSISLRKFLGYGLAKTPPEHSTLSKTRKRLSLKAHGAAEALRASPARSLRPGRSSPLSSVGGGREETMSDTINPKNQPSVKAG